MTIKLSYSRLDKFLACPREYKYCYVDNLEKRVFNINFFIGNLIHFGLHLAFTKDDDLFHKLGVEYDRMLDELREEHLFSPEEEQKFEEWRVIILGMIYAYCLKYATFIDTHTHMYNEKEYNIIIPYKYGDIDFKIKIDNIIQSKDTLKLFVHEAKTTRELTESYVWAIQNKLQPALYYYLGKMTDDINPEGIIYDVLQKPSIRVKKNEAYHEYLDRLEAYYHDEPDKHLWMEIINEPTIKKADIFETIKDVAERIHEGRFSKSWKNCGLCDYYKLCFNDDAPEYMLMYKKKEYSNG